jgi:uncharacterized protein YheU (UPF0270 family)
MIIRQSSGFHYFMIIPPDSLSKDVLHRLIVDFVTRDGTDVGHDEISIDSKVEKTKGLLYSGEVVITFDEETETCSIIRK